MNVRVCMNDTCTLFQKIITTTLYYDMTQSTHISSNTCCVKPAFQNPSLLRYKYEQRLAGHVAASLRRHMIWQLTDVWCASDTMEDYSLSCQVSCSS